MRPCIFLLCRMKIHSALLVQLIFVCCTSFQLHAFFFQVFFFQVLFLISKFLILSYQRALFLSVYFVFQPGCPFSPCFQIDNPFHDLQSRPLFPLLRLRAHSSLSVKPTKSFYRCLLSLPVHCCKLIFTSS